MRKNFTDWIDQYTPLRVQPRALAKEDYNAVRLGILRLGNPLRLELLDLRGINCILDDNAWVFIDDTINDMPVLAWTKFKPRESINTSIVCELRLYHMHAGLLISRSLDALQDTIHVLLKEKFAGHVNDEIIKIGH